MAPFNYDPSAWYATGTGSSTVTQIVWSAWANNTISGNVIDSGTSSSYYTSQVWVAWCASNTSYTPIVDSRTPEQIEAARVAALAREAEWAAKREERRVAEEKAKQLLIEALDEAQRAEFAAQGYFHVETREGTRRYRLAPGSQPRRVHGEDGMGYTFCIHPVYSYPAGDTVLAQKLLLETDEDSFLRIANGRQTGRVAVIG